MFQKINKLGRKIFLRAPYWWYIHKKIPLWLRCLSSIYGIMTESYTYFHCRIKSVQQAQCPVISVGNMVMGGAGKTPLTEAIVLALLEENYKPLIITRGYKGHLRGPIRVNPLIHTHHDVGEEALLLAALTSTYVAAKRADVLPLIPFSARHIFVLDDAHQHHSLKKDVQILVFNTNQLYGNGHIFPAGPLRQSFVSALASCHGVCLIGNVDESLDSLSQASNNHLKNICLQHGVPLFFIPAHFSCALSPAHAVLGFAGIGYPDRFLGTLSALFSHSIAFESYPDHHIYTHSDELFLKQRADENQKKLVTTRKDWIKLSPCFRQEVAVVEQKLILPQDFRSFLYNNIL